MDKDIRELIESATINGTISEKEREFIVKKAIELGIDETEVNIFIKANLNKNAKEVNQNVLNTDIKGQNENTWIKFNEFKIGNWINLLGIILIFSSGFFPWLTSHASSSGFGQSFSGSSSIDGGFFYTLPLSIAAIFITLKRSYTNLRFYFGPLVMLLAVGLISSYTSKVGSSYGGVSASASTDAGPGVLLLFVSGLVYFIGSMFLLDKNSKVKILFTNDYSVLIYFLFLIITPNFFNTFNFSIFPAVFLAVIFGGFPLLLALNKKFRKTKNILIGNLSFWLLIIILPEPEEVLDSNSNLIKYAIETFEKIDIFYVFAFTIISLTALLIDYLEIKSKKLESINKFNFVFNPLFSAFIFLIPFLCITLYSSLTKYKVTYDELKAFNEKNTKISGNWYFLNSDSTEVNNLQITDESNISAEENGDIELLLKVSFDEGNTIKMKEYESELKIKEKFNFEIKYPIVFGEIFEVKSIENNLLIANLKSRDNKNISIIATRDYRELQNVVQTKQDRLSILNDSNQQDVPFSNGEFTVVADKCYFYSEPYVEYKQKAYLVSGQTGYYSQVMNNFVFVTFTNTNGVTTEGWLNLKDIRLMNY